MDDFYVMDYLNSIGYSTADHRFNVDFNPYNEGSLAPHNSHDLGHLGTVFNLSDKVVSAAGNNISADGFTFALPDGTVLPLDNFTDDILEFFTGFDRSTTLTFSGTAQNDVFVFESLNTGLEGQTPKYIEYELTSGNDSVIFPEIDSWNKGIIDSDFAGGSTWEDREMLLSSDDFDSSKGLIYKFKGDDVTITSNNPLLDVSTTAKNVFKIYDFDLTDDVFIGSTGEQEFKSQGGHDTVTGGAGADRFRISKGWSDAAALDGQSITITDYSNEDTISIEDFGIVDLSHLSLSVEGGYTSIFAKIDDVDYGLVHVKGVYEFGVATTDNDGDIEIDFYDPKKTPQSEFHDGSFRHSLFGDVWKDNSDIEYLGGKPDKPVLFKGGDGDDSFSGGAGDDHFSGGGGYNRIMYFDSKDGIFVRNFLTETGEMSAKISDGMGFGAYDTFEKIDNIYGSKEDDFFNLSSDAMGVKRILPGFGNDYIEGNVNVGYWDLVNDPSDPRGDDGHSDRIEDVVSAHIEVILEKGEVHKFVSGGENAGEYMDMLVGNRGIYGSEGNDIFNVTTDKIVTNANGDGRFVWANLGDDTLIDLGRGNEWLAGGHGDDTIISGYYLDTVYGDYEADEYQVEGDDTFAVLGDGYTDIRDWEVGESVWWLDTLDTLSSAPTVADDLIVTFDFGSQTTKIGTLNSELELVNRIEINGFLEVESAYIENFSATGYTGATSGLRMELFETTELPYQISNLGSGSDKFLGGDEFDLVTSGGGADYISLGKGDDVALIEGVTLSTDKNPFDGKSNFSIVDTGTGSDTVEISTDFEGSVKLVSGGGTDTIVINSDSGAFSWGAGTGAGAKDLILTSSDASIILSNQMAHEDNLVFSYIEFVSVDPITGQETSEIFQIDPSAPPAEGGMVTLLGTDSNVGDILDVGWDSGPASIAGLKGDDVIEGGVSDDYLDGGEGDDLLEGNSGEDTLSGGLGEDLLAGGHGSDKLFGGLGDDIYKIDLSYDGFLDRAGYDNAEENRDDIVIGNVDTITDDGGADRVWITNFQPSTNPFDQYKDMLSIDGDGTLVMKWGFDADSPTSYQHTLREGFDNQKFDPVVEAAIENGGYVVTKTNVNSATEQPKYTWPVFAEEWQAENYYREQNALGFDEPATVHKITITPKNIANEYEKGYALESATTVKTQEFWVPGEAGGDYPYVTSEKSDFSNGNLVNVADTLYYDKIGKDYQQGGDLSSLNRTGENTKFDIGHIETWPGFDNLPEAIDPANPEAGTQEYYSELFELGDSTTYPSIGEMPFIKVITGYEDSNGYMHDGFLISMEELEKAAGGDRGIDELASELPVPSESHDEQFATISNEDAELAQGFKVTDFAVKDEYGNWVNTIESIVFTSPTTDHAIEDKYAEGVLKGTKSGYDSITDALKTGLGTEYFLSPSGVVDMGTVLTPATFNPDGSVKTFKEVKNWDGPETDKNFFLIANTDMAGQNTSGLGFDGSTADYTLSGDKDAATPLYFGANDVLMSGAAKHDIMVGSNNDDFVDVMFGHGGDDAMQAEGGRNIVVGGSGADTFVIEAVGQQTVIYGDHVAMESLGYGQVGDDLEAYQIDTQNESYGDKVFFDFTWPLTGEDGEKNPDSYIEQLGDRHFNVHHTTENGDVIDVALFDVEGAYFSDGEGGLEYHALTTGRPITKDDFGSLNFESQGVKFLVEANDETVGGATTISVVTSVTKTITDPVTKEKITYEDPTVKWKGLASEADSFVFNDVTVNVINAVQTDMTGAPITDTTIYGTSGIDLIIGDEFDNLIFGGDDNDIIFGGDGADEIYGEGGDDVLIGGDMDDILYGDFQHEIDEPEVEYDTKNKILNEDEISGNDVIIGGTGIDKIDSGDGQNVVVSGDLSSVILNAELDDFNTFLNYDEDDLPI